MNKKRILLLGAIILLAAVICVVLLTKQANAPAPSANSTNSSQTQPNNKQPEPKTFDKTKFSTSDPTSPWVVVNKKRPLTPKTYAPNYLIAVGGGQQLRKEAATALKTLINASKTEGLTISPLSGYRSYSTQVSVYNNEVQSNGKAVADSQSARPGYSEHQTGWAIDVGGGGCGIEDCFGNTAEGKWLAANAYKHGFIIRYTSGKESITGYRAEPWHIRYIGKELAAEMQTKGVETLEEFFSLPAAPNY